VRLRSIAHHLVSATFAHERERNERIFWPKGVQIANPLEFLYCFLGFPGLEICAGPDVSNDQECGVVRRGRAEQLQRMDGVAMVQDHRPHDRNKDRLHYCLFGRLRAVC
jgi:hypothetical protein